MYCYGGHDLRLVLYASGFGRAARTRLFRQKRGTTRPPAPPTNAASLLLFHPPKYMSGIRTQAASVISSLSSGRYLLCYCEKSMTKLPYLY
jgi:hypothetical protein